MTVEPERDAKRERYDCRWYGVDPKSIAEMRKLQPHKPILAAIVAWLWILLLVKTFLYLANWTYLYPIVILFIAGRAGVFLQLAHEAAHSMISRGKFNNWFGTWICTYPIGLNFPTYAKPHLRHHICTNMACDPAADTEKYKMCDIRNPKLWLLFLKDLSGITAITIKLLHEKGDAEQYGQGSAAHLEPEETYKAFHHPSGSKLKTLKIYSCISLVQLIIMAVIFNFNPFHYVALWLLPLITVHMFLMRVRGIAEHGLGMQLGITDLDQKNRGELHTRSMGTSASRYAFTPLNWLECALIGSLNVNYHHEHHLFPTVPYYNLPKLHRLLREKERQINPHIFTKGYFDCLFFNLKHPIAKAAPSLP